jgi:hypothetical protein
MAVVITHRIKITVKAPAKTVKGVTANYYYLVRNVGTSTFSGTIQIMLSWDNLTHNVYQPLNVTNLAPNSEVRIDYSQAPLNSGYTWFVIAGATVTNIEILNDGNNIIFPYGQIGNQQFVQPLYAMPARSPEEKELRNALTVAVASLAVIAIFQIIDWAVRFFYHV